MFSHDAISASEPAATLRKVDDLLRGQAWQQAETLLKPLYLDFPRSSGVLVALAKCHCMQGDFDFARRYLEQALTYDPSHGDALATLGVVFQMLGDGLGALDCLERALALDENNTEVMGNLGHVYTLNARMEEAITLLECAVAMAPDSAVLRNNLGRAMVESGYFNDALIHLNHALHVDPHYASALYNRGMARLGMGHLETGWPEWEFRFRANCSAKRSPAYDALPLWQGESLQGKCIVVYAEQGLGDELLFASCIPDLAKQAGQVFLQCNPRLVSLFARSFPSVTVHGGPRDEPLDWLRRFGGANFQIPIGSLPQYLRRRLDEFPGTNAYLKADSERVAYWKQRLVAMAPGIKVGFAWRSKLQDPLRRRRYTQLSDWLAMFRTLGVQTICLQYDDCTEELDTLARDHGVCLTRFPELDLMNDLDESVALMSALDLVVSVITSTFRFAAGAGVETWLLAPPVRNWVNLGTDGLPWYPTVHMFRQSVMGQWDDVVSRVVDSLKVKIGDPTELVDLTFKPANSIRMMAADGLRYHQEGDFAAAERHYHSVLSLDNDDVETLMLLGTLLAQTGHAEEGLLLLTKAAILGPRVAHVHINLGFVYQKLGRYNEEIAAYRSACKLDPTLRVTWLNLGKVLNQSGRWQEAIAEMDRAMELFPASAEIQSVCGKALLAIGEPARAEMLLRRAVELEPNNAASRNDLGRCLFELGRDAQALAEFRVAVQLKPDWAEAWVHLGASTQEPSEAQVHLERALEIDAHMPQAHQNLALNLLAQGNLDCGWEEWEWRLKSAEPFKISTAYDTIPLWRGEDIHGKTLLVHAEQGIGEELLFSSCIPDLLARGTRCLVQCDVRLESLFKRAFPGAMIHGGPRLENGDWLSAYGQIDVRVPSGTLPKWLRKQVSDFPCTPGHLWADKERVAYWRRRLDTDEVALKVGICWCGGASGRHRSVKSTALADWEAVLRTKGVRFFSLQYGVDSDEADRVRETVGVEVRHISEIDLYNDIDDTAALISALDLVISTSGYILHLAGSLGRPTWLLGPPMSKYLPLGTSTIPWYPSVRWWPKPDWDKNLKNVAAALVSCAR